MSDLIERDKVMDVLDDFQSNVENCVGNAYAIARQQMIAIPSARPKGEWIVYEGGWKDLDYYPPKCKCNQCGYEEELYILNAKPTNFCPNCGAKMFCKGHECP